MKKKRTVSAIAQLCAAAISISTMSAASVYAVTSPQPAANTSSSSAGTSGVSVTSVDDKDMTAAITDVKTRLDIPDSYSDFRYSVSRNQGLKAYSFTWQHPKTDDGGYSVTLTGDVITQYSAPDSYHNSYKPSIGAFT
ncbi:MAG: hypothetical protein NC078_06540, partial [Ruminococcus sp.]|nr:hypothetical protein [Ruminococcus sp.]